ncbi:MAG: hypothetical protein RIB45_13780 [Marivibrio sp.]|uniref:hypothetical protein n=1 Tax=Marivibrio sp. TaxID=2039719 RepID=UPI0032EB1D5C
MVAREIGRLCAAAVCAGLLAGCVHERGPRLAVAMGDSFISGEGAEDFITGDGFDAYSPVDGSTPQAGEFFNPEVQTDPYFCHRSDASSIYEADLPTIPARRNIACSGATPTDVNEPQEAFVTPNGPNLPPQSEQLWDAIEGHDLKLLKASLGGNNFISRFGELVAYCYAAFMTDAAGGPAASIAVGQVNGTFDPDDGFFPRVQEAIRRNTCFADQFYTPGRDVDGDGVSDLEEVTRRLVDNMTPVIEGLRERGYEPGEWTLVMQGYVSPFSTDPAARFISPGEETENERRFADLARARYRAGCPVHLRSMQDADGLAIRMSQAPREAARRLRDAFPGERILFLDVARSMDGVRLCDQPSSPRGAAFNPIWFRDPNNGERIVRDLPAGGLRNFANTWANLARACRSDREDAAFARCQESAHPNALGHKILGQCLDKLYDQAWRAPEVNEMRCVRSPDNGLISVAPVSAES